MSWTRRIILGLLALALAAGIVLALLPRPAQVEVARVDRGQMRVTVEEDGRTRVRTRYVVSAPVAGSLERISLQAGDSVQQDAVVARVRAAESSPLDPRSRAEVRGRVSVAQATMQQAKAEAERAHLGKKLAEQELERTLALARQGAIPAHDAEVAQVEYDSRVKEAEAAELAVRVAAQEAAAARALLATFDGASRGKERELEIKTPAPGRVLRVLQENAGVVAPGTPLLEIGDPTSLEVVVDVLTSDAVRVRGGDRAQLGRWGGEAPLRGKVRLVEPSAFTKVSALGVEEQRVNVIIEPDPDDKQWERVGDGFRVDASIVTWEGAAVLRAPTTALFRSGDQWAVFVVSGGKAAQRAIGIGHRNDSFVEVTSGLSEGDVLIVHPSDKVSEGVKVEPVK